jgi:hypothetical protein
MLTNSVHQTCLMQLQWLVSKTSVIVLVSSVCIVAKEHIQ